MVKKTRGFNWAASAGVSTPVWKGVLLRDVLLKCGVLPRVLARASCASRAPKLLPGEAGKGSTYGTSITAPEPRPCYGCYVGLRTERGEASSGPWVPSAAHYPWVHWGADGEVAPEGAGDERGVAELLTTSMTTGCCRRLWIPRGPTQNVSALSFYSSYSMQDSSSSLLLSYCYTVYPGLCASQAGGTSPSTSCTHYTSSSLLLLLTDDVLWRVPSQAGGTSPSTSDPLHLLIITLLLTDMCCGVSFSGLVVQARVHRRLSSPSAPPPPPPPTDEELLLQTPAGSPGGISVVPSEGLRVLGGGRKVTRVEASLDGAPAGASLSWRTQRPPRSTGASGAGASGSSEWTWQTWWEPRKSRSGPGTRPPTRSPSGSSGTSWCAPNLAALAPHTG